MPESDWPPRFTVATQNILELFTGESFYSSVDASIREAVLNAIDSIGRRRETEAGISSQIEVVFDRQASTVTVSDNGDGMGPGELTDFFSKVGASVAEFTARHKSDGYSAVGEFGIGVLSYFLVCDQFEVHTVRQEHEAIGLVFPRSMLNAEDPAIVTDPKRTEVGTTLILSIREAKYLNLLIDRFPYWMRDVEGLIARCEPEGEEVKQGGLTREVRVVPIDTPDWIHEAHIGPPILFSSWDSFDGSAHVDVLYRGVFVNRVSVSGLWAIEGAIHVDPKHFRPKLNREGFVGGGLEEALSAVLRAAHPKVLEGALDVVVGVLPRDETRSWSLLKWVTLWLAVPRSGAYTKAARLWDDEFRRRRTFRLLLKGARKSRSRFTISKLSG